MHTNYENVTVTIIHDLFLRKMPFQDSITACFCIIMSSCFTRGWTALELAKSRRVKIIFADAILNLDSDVLMNIDEELLGWSAANSIKK